MTGGTKPATKTPACRGAGAGASPPKPPHAGRPTVRDSVDSDLPAIHAIYAHHVRHGFASFEETPPDADEMSRRRADLLARNHPYIVAEIDGTVVGYAHAAPYRPRSAYRYTVENTVYVAPNATGRAALLRSVGFKFGRWVDTVILQRALGEGDRTIP